MTTATNHSLLETIPLELTTQLGYQQQFIEGDEIQFLLSLGSDAYVYMYHIDANNKLTQLLPSKKQASNFYTTGYFLTVPEYDDGYRFIVDKPLGKEFIWLLASDRLTPLDTRPADMVSIKKRLKQGSSRAYGETVFEFTTIRK